MLVKTLQNVGISKDIDNNGLPIYYTAKDLLNMSDADKENIMIEAQKALVGQSTGMDKTLAEYNLKQMEQAHAKNERTRETSGMS